MTKIITSLFSLCCQIFAAMKLQLFRYDTFRHHSRMCIEPAIVHKWRNWQGEMLQQISQREKVIVGGGMRADSPGTLWEKLEKNS